MTLLGLKSCLRGADASRAMSADQAQDLLQYLNPQERLLLGQMGRSVFAVNGSRVVR